MKKNGYISYKAEYQKHNGYKIGYTTGYIGYTLKTPFL